MQQSDAVHFVLFISQKLVFTENQDIADALLWIICIQIQV